jgi:hypothetical protein
MREDRAAASAAYDDAVARARSVPTVYLRTYWNNSGATLPVVAVPSEPSKPCRIGSATAADEVAMTTGVRAVGPAPPARARNLPGPRTPASVAQPGRTGAPNPAGPGRAAAGGSPRRTSALRSRPRAGTQSSDCRCRSGPTPSDRATPPLRSHRPPARTRRSRRRSHPVSADEGSEDAAGTGRALAGGGDFVGRPSFVDSTAGL